ncbi:fatty acid synthase, partial [Biomphalaria glabrata]
TWFNNWLSAVQGQSFKISWCHSSDQYRSFSFIEKCLSLISSSLQFGSTWRNLQRLHGK